MKRTAITLSPKLAGTRIQIGLAFDGERIVDVRVDLHKVGSYGRELHHAVAALASGMLRRGATAGEVGAILRGTEGGPVGAVEDLDGVTHALSVADLLGQVLAVYR